MSLSKSLLLIQQSPEGTQELDLSGHQLKALSPEIGKLTQLKKLILGKYLYDAKGNVTRIVGNDIMILPPEIGLLTELEELSLIGNQLSTLPPEIAQLTKLKSLAISDNLLNNAYLK